METSISHITERIEEEKKKLQLLLDGLHTKEQRLRALTRYFSIIHPHSIPLCSYMQNSVSHPAAEYAIADNIGLELKENHQYMLYLFMKQFGVSYDAKEYDALVPIMHNIMTVLARGIPHKEGIAACLVIYMMEELSRVFIPWMQIIASDEGYENLEYTQKHGDADIMHSAQALFALTSECENSNSSQIAEAETAFENVVLLFEKIFAPV